MEIIKEQNLDGTWIYKKCFEANEILDKLF